MAVSLQRFREAALAGHADRLALDAAGTGLERRGTSAGGRAVEWLRWATGRDKQQNRDVMHAFVAALKAEHGGTIGGRAEAVLNKVHDGGAKPLSSRNVRQVLEAVDRAKAEAKAANEGLAWSYSPQAGGKLGSIYSVAVASAAVAFAGSHHVYNRLLDEGSGEAETLRTAIAGAIRAAGDDGKVRLNEFTAAKIAREVVTDHLRAAQRLDDVLAGPEQQARVGGAAREMGVPALADALSDLAGPVARGTREGIELGIRGQGTDWDDPGIFRKVVQARMPRALAQEVVAGGHVASLRRLPADLEFAERIGEKIVGDVIKGDKLPGQRAAAAALIDREIVRLGQGTPAERQLAGKLQDGLAHAYQNLPTDEIKLNVLVRERDADLARARAHGSHDTWGRGNGEHNAWMDAARRQNDIVALRLRQLGQSPVATGEKRLRELARGSPELADALAGLDRIEREYIAAQGGDPNGPGLGWSASRDGLAGIREKARSLAGEAEGNELQALISDRTRELTADMLRRGMQVLGPPPVPFAALSLGSASRGEASPYSDVEFAFLLDGPRTPEAEDYCRRLSQLVQLQVTNLGENDGREAPIGFHWDTGLNSPHQMPDSFIGTADELIGRNLMEDLGGGPSQMFGLTMFANAELLHGSRDDGSDWALVKDFQQKVDGHFRGASPVRQGATTGQSLGRWMSGEASAVARLRHAATTDAVDVKAIARLPMMLAQGLALEHGVGTDAAGDAANSTLSRLDALVDAGVLSRKDADTLADAFVELGRVRIEAHLHAGWADDRVQLDPDKARAEGAYEAPELRQVIQNLLPFVDRIERHAADPGSPF